MVDTSKSMLIGHALGGYFTSYTILHHSLGKSNSFSSYVAASPSIHFNKYYLLSRLQKISSQKKRQKKISYLLHTEEKKMLKAKTTPVLLTLAI
jgi:predicted alpha/beta superfamily hydrolase